MAKKIKAKAKKLQNLDTALQYYQSGDLLEAEKICRHILNRQADQADAGRLLVKIAAYYNDSGIALISQGLAGVAIENFRIAIEVKPDFAEAYNNLGNALFDRFTAKKNEIAEIPGPDDPDLNEAIRYFKNAIELKPEFAEAYSNLGNAFSDKGSGDEAIKCYKKALTIAPFDAEIYYNLAAAFSDKGTLNAAIENLKKALTFNPGFTEAYYNLGSALIMKGMLDEAIDNYKKALTLKPDYANVHWDMSLALLKIGDFEQGWRKYEWRFLAGVASLPLSLLPRWDGSPLKGRILLIHAEQGVGDEIMFASCLPDVTSHDGHFVLECDRRLMPLFSRSFPEARLIPRLSVDDPEETFLKEADVKTAIGSLPQFFRTDLDSFPRQKSYLVPDKQKVEIWSDRYKELGEGLKVGISWRGGKKSDLRQMRSISLEQWSQIFSITEDVKKFHVPKIHFINLQYGNCTHELKEIKEKLGVTVHDWEDAVPLKDLDNFAAQIAALDLVISVDNSTVHLTGALGVPVWAMLPFACDWRWMQDVEDTPWYESVRLYRQKSFGEWESVLERIKTDLKEYVTTGVMPVIDKKYSYKEAGKD